LRILGLRSVPMDDTNSSKSAADLANTSTDAETDKIRAEAKRLLAETTKLECEADKVRREASLLAHDEAAKIAEREKLLAETEKLRAETADIKKHVLLRPVTWLTLGAAFIALATGISTFFGHSAEMTEKYANAAKELASIREKQKNDAEQHVKDLQVQGTDEEKRNAELAKQNGELTTDNGRLLERNTVLTKQYSQVQNNLASVQVQLKQSKSDLALVGLTKAIVILQRLEPERLKLEDADRVAAEIEALKGAPADYDRALNELRITENSSSGVYKIVYRYVLLKLTRQEAQKSWLIDSMTNESTPFDNVTLLLPINREILKTQFFDVEVRANYLRLLDQKHFLDAVWNIPVAVQFALWDKEASTKYPRLYASCLRSMILQHFISLRRDINDLSESTHYPSLTLDTFHAGDGRLFFDLSPQVAVASLLLALMPNAKEDFGREFSYVKLALREEDMKKINETFPAAFPCNEKPASHSVGGARLCSISRGYRDLLTLRMEGEADYKWIESNLALLEILQSLPKYEILEKDSQPVQLYTDLIASRWISLQEAQEFVSSRQSAKSPENK